MSSGTGGGSGVVAAALVAGGAGAGDVVTVVAGVADACSTAAEAGARGFDSCDHPSSTAIAKTAPAPANAKFLDRVFFVVRACSIALETDALSETDSGYDAPLSFDRTALSSFAISSALV
jgi:hypothetical protein